MKKGILVLMLALLAVILIACAGNDTPTTPAAPSVEETPAAQESTPDTTAPEPEVPGDIHIGYVVNLMSHEWYQNICQGAEAQAGILGVKLSIADANNDVNTQLNACENFIAQGVDALVITPVDPLALVPIINAAHEKGIPVITESVHTEGEDTFVGISDLDGGLNVGRWYAQYCLDNNVSPNILAVNVPALQACNWRVEGFLNGLEEAGIDYSVVEVDGAGLKEQAISVSTDALTANSDINCIFGINDDSATGGMAAFLASGLDPADLTVIGFGFEGQVGRNALLDDGPYKAACAMFPNFVGVALIDVAVAHINGNPPGALVQTPTVAITQDNFRQFYKPLGDDWEIDFDAVRALMG